MNNQVWEVNNQLWEVNNQIPKFRELVMGTSFSVYKMCIYSVIYIQKLIKFPAQFCFLHGIKAFVFLGPFLCSPHCCTQPSFLGISVQPSLMHLTFFQPFFRLLCVSFFSHFFPSFVIVVPDFSTILQPSFLV